MINEKVRHHFPRTKNQIYLNAAGMMPLSDFAQAGMDKFVRYQSMGEETDYVREMQRSIRSRFANLVGADEAEIGLVHCTKAGEQIALDAVDAIKMNGNIVTNDLHFTGSLHNLEGLRRAGRDVRFVRAHDWKADVNAMIDALDLSLIHI